LEIHRSSARNAWIVGLLAVVAGVAAFWVWGLSNTGTSGHSDKAYMPNVETLAESSAIDVKGTVLDEGTAGNLRRDADDPRKESSTVVPGTDYTVVVEQAIKGDIPAGTQIKVAVSGGKYKGKSEPLAADVVAKKAYYFFLAAVFHGGGLTISERANPSSSNRRKASSGRSPMMPKPARRLRTPA